MANDNETQNAVPPAEENTETEAVTEKKPGFFGRIFSKLFGPFIKIYQRIILALSNTFRRIWNAIKFICSKLWFVLKRVLIVAAVLGVIAGGFYLGLYLRLFNLEDVNRSLMLWKWPVIGENFVEPPPLPEPEPEPEPEKPAGKTEEAAKPKVEDVRPKTGETKGNSKPIKITREEIERQMKEAAKEEKKRSAKLARLYENMKPKEAADIMDEMEETVVISVLQRMDESQAAKILANMDPGKAARLSNIIFHGGSVSTRR